MIPLLFAAAYLTERARIGANFTDPATENIPRMVRFQQIGDATYIAREDAQQPIAGYHGLMVFALSRVVRGARAGGAAAILGSDVGHGAAHRTVARSVSTIVCSSRA